MGKNSRIEWTHHTFNPWIGCAKIAPGCDHCYAASQFQDRFRLVRWGTDGTRRRTSDANWQLPRRWNMEASVLERRQRVFCGSCCDVFEDREELRPWRRDLWALIGECESLDWLLLTKRPHNVGRLWPMMGPPITQLHELQRFSNIWLGVSVSDQATADELIPMLFRYRRICPVLFVSAEPLLGPIDLALVPGDASQLDWVIAGGETGPRARPMHPRWAMDLAKQCDEAGIAFFFKGWGSWAPCAGCQDPRPGRRPTRHAVVSLSGELTIQFQDHPRVGETRRSQAIMSRVGRRAAGRELAGRILDEMPSSKTAANGSIGHVPAV